ncbi:MAG: helix-turn-helix transcriptional regulator [Mycobacteriales bacterium]
MSQRRNERLVNLVICLLSSRRFLTADEIARTVPGYAHDDADAREHASFQRRFERDKSELRELGVPLEVGTTSIFDTETGYRIPARDYALPEIELDPAAATAVGLAARLWQNASLSSAAASALRKLRVSGAIAEAVPGPDGGESDGRETGRYAGLELTPVARPEPALEPLLAAARARRTVRFAYQSPTQHAAASHSAPVVRELQPWGTVAWRGRWYVVGHDVDRDAPRCFRLSRICGPVQPVGKIGAYTPPAKLDLLTHVTQLPPIELRQVARVRVPKHGAAGLRRFAESAQPGLGDTDILTLAFDRSDWFAAMLTSYGPTVTVLDPPELRDAVIERLQALAEFPAQRSGAAERTPVTVGR